MRKRLGRLLAFVLSVAIVLNSALVLGGKTVSAAVGSGTRNGFYYEFNGTNCSIKEYTGPAGAVTIPATIDGYNVTDIDQSAFAYAPEDGRTIQITSVTIPNSVKTIGNYAFQRQPITTINFGSGVNSIGASAFASNTAITNVTIPANVRSIGNSAFDSCTALTTVSISDGVQTIGSRAFNGCSRLNNLSLPGSLTSIGSYAFASTKITSVTLGRSGTNLAIANNAFNKCTSLSTVTLNAGVVSILDEAFNQCPIVTLKLPATVTSFGQRVLMSAKSTGFSVDSGNNTYKAVNGALYTKDGKTLVAIPSAKSGSFTIADGTTTIAPCAAYGCANLTAITIPNSVTTIGNSAFASCSSVKTVTFKTVSTLRTVGDSAFSGMTALTKLDFPQSVTSIGANACNGDRQCEITYYQGTSVGADAFNYTKNTNILTSGGGCSHQWDGACDTTCNLCGLTRTAGNHSWASNCDTTCDVCGTTRTTSTNHTWNSTGTECTLCHFTQSHTHTPITVNGRAATCTAAGLSNGTKCSTCGAVLTAQTSIPALGHNSVSDPAVAATCTTAGKTAGSHCSRCNAVLTAQTTVAALGHSAVKDAAVAPTCTMAGKTEGSHCSRCKVVITSQTTVSALGHNVVKDAAVAATCTTAGKTEGSHCSRCNAVITSQSTIAALGHSWSGNCDTTCNRSGCTYTRTNTAAHSWQSNSCGSKCTVCQATQGSNHSYSGDCDSICNNCGGNRVVTTGHSYNNNTCDDKCRVCQETRVAPHNYSSACDTTCNSCSATRTVNVSHTYRHDCDVDCELCGATRTINHTYSNACDADCNVCGTRRTPSAHVYTNACDTTCNVCGAARNTSHTYSNACDADCNVCGARRTPSAHVYDNASDATCNVCGATRTVATPTPTPTTPSQPSTPSNTSEGGVAGFVERLYTVALGRKSDPNGKADWIRAIRNGATGADAAYGFLFSAEFLNKGMSNNEFVTVLYKTFFDRQPDQAGLNAWVAALQRGDSKQDVIMGFINSTEWANVCLRYGINSGGTGTPNITVEPNEQVIAFATRLYTTCLKRSPDQNGLMAWARQLANLRDTGSNAAHGFFFSDEMNNNPVSNEEFVTRLYLTFMDRQPDQGGMNAWVGQLNSGVSREEVFQGFAQSSEFGQICANYGIIR